VNLQFFTGHVSGERQEALKALREKHPDKAKKQD